MAAGSTGNCGKAAAGDFIWQILVLNGNPSRPRHARCLYLACAGKQIAGIDVETRRAVPGDAPCLAHLMTELGYPTSIDEMAARMAALTGRADHAVFVMVHEAVAAGMVAVSASPSLFSNDPQGAIIALVVSSRFRGRGIGALLVERGEKWFRENGIGYVTVKPSRHREDAHRLYARLGYEHSGLRFSKSLT